MKKRLFLVAMLVAALFLAGCITLKIENDIRPNGSGTKSQIIAVDMEAIEGFAQSMGVTPEPGAEEENPLEDSFGELEQNAATVPGATVEEYRDPATGREGVKVIAPFASLDELVALSSTELFGSVDAISFQQSGSSTVMNITVSTGDLGEEVSESAGESGGEEATPSPDEEAAQQQMLQMMNIEFTYSVIVPGVIADYDPKDSATVEGNKITWDLSQALLETEADSVAMMVQWESGGAPPPPAAPPAEATPGAPSPQPQPPSQPVVTPGAGGPGLQPPAPEEKKACLPCCPAGLLPLGLIGSGALLLTRKRLPLS
ncbi:MAG: hypothetical protein E3J21_18100 [Anaerolineales bacterium]|nr:MAG: hypothetical protein E3J21_18100 [Anaerolineales bacterium]